MFAVRPRFHRFTGKRIIHFDEDANAPKHLIFRSEKAGQGDRSKNITKGNSMIRAYQRWILLATVLCVQAAVSDAAGLKTGDTRQASGTSSPAPSGNTSGGNVNVQILMNTINALQQQNNAQPTPTPTPAPSAAPYVNTATPEITPAPTSAGFDCQALIAEEMGRVPKQDIVEARFNIASIEWRDVYQWARSDNADYVRSRYDELAARLADPQFANRRASTQCKMNALAARLNELGASVADPGSVTSRGSVPNAGSDAKAVTQAHRARMRDVVSSSASTQSSGAGRKRKVLPQYASCLRIVDVRSDSDVKNMYWYAVENTCGEALSAHWCEGKGCSKPTQAADIAAGNKEPSWMHAASVLDVRFRGTACMQQYNGKNVQYDKQRNQCWILTD
ncbi:hypothetical protein [Pandoraea sp. NPDC090278]|uniref:hypothetical protein n=1 Tax=Pandoraea sp. NPDC090278 TaxID=3364391 RepID=UPI00383BB561